MPGEDAIKIEGRIVAVLPKTLFRVELPNGHCIMAHVRRRNWERAAGLNVGDNATVEVSPFDFSKGRLVWSEKE